MSCSGCGWTPGAGLLVNNGIANPADVQCIIYQASTWTMPQPQLFPLQRPNRVTDTAAIRTFYEAMNHPRGGLQPRTFPNSRLAFVARDGRVVIFAVGGSEAGCKSCEADLAAASRLAFRTSTQRRFDTTAVPSTALSRLSYHSNKDFVTLKPGVHLTRVEKTWLQLLATYNPLSLRGNVRYTPKELKRFLAWVPEYLEVKVKKPVIFEAIVVPPDLDPKWPPKKGDNRARLEKLEYDTVYVARLPETRSSFVRFVFSSKRGDCLATDAVYPKAILNYIGKHERPTYGPDLFNEVVSAVLECR